MNQSKAATGPSEWKLHWPLLLAATFGISFGSIPISSLGLFMQPLQDAFGWNRTTISAGTTVFAVVVMIATPLAGILVDRLGSRAVAIPGLALCGLTFACFGLLNGMVAVWVGIWVVYSLVSVLIRTMVWNPPVATAFVANRGVALAIMLSGMSVASAATPLLTHWLISALGWRLAYVALGLGWIGIALLLVIPFFRMPGTTPVARVGGAPAEADSAPLAPATVPGGLTFGQAIRSPTMIRIALACLLSTMVGSAWGVHMVPIYVSLGVERVTAASLAVVAGASAIAARLVFGSILDRFNFALLPFILLALPALPYGLLLMSGGSLPIIFTVAFLVGVGSGASLYLIIYLTTQYGGLRHFGKIYGTISALTGLATAIGPVSAGWIYDTTDSYEMFLFIGIPIFILAGLCVFGLGPYPQFEPEPAPASHQ